MIRYFVKHPVTTIMLVMVFVVLGAVSYLNIPVERTPKIDFPIVTITTALPGATPLEVETLTTNKIEEAVSELSEIKDMASYSYEGYGMVMVEFNLSANVNNKFIEVKDKVEGIINELPDTAERPTVEKFDPLVVPVMYLVLTSDSMDSRDMYEFADKKLKNELAKVQGVATVDIIGGQERQINVLLDPMRMKQYYITVQDVVDRIANMNRNIPGGDLKRSDNTVSVRFIGEFQTVEEMKKLVMVSEDGEQFTLGDIARIEDGAKDLESIARFNGVNGVGLAVKKVSDGFAVDIAKRIHKALPNIRKTLPEGVELKVATDTTEYIVSETKECEGNILMGILLTVIVLYMFTGRYKLTLIGSVIIPTSLISTLFLMDMADFSLNMMTLLAIAVSMGTLIANAIVIIESVLVHLEKGETPQEAAIKGTEEVFNAVLASAGTNLVVFTPIAFMGGIVGQFFKPFGLTVVFATIFSLIASFTLTPMMCGLLLSSGEVKGNERKRSWNPFRWLVTLTDVVFTFIEKEYEHFYRWMFRHTKLTVFLVVLSFMAVMKFITPYVDSEFYPGSDSDEITAMITMPQGTRVNKTSDVVRQIESHIGAIPEVRSYFTNIGDNGEENAQITISLTPSKKRDRSDLDIINAMIPMTARVPDAEIYLARTGGMGDPTQGDVSIDIYGEEFEDLSRIAREAKEKMLATGFFRSVVSSYKDPNQEIQFIPDQNKMTFFGVDNKDVSAILRDSLYGDDSNVYKEKGEDYDINVELRDEYKTDMDEIGQISIISRKGLIPITELGQLERTKATPPIRHTKRERIIRLEGFLSKSSLGHLREVLTNDFKDITFPVGYGYNFVGDSEHQDETNTEILKAFVLAIVLTYMLLCAIMDSMLYPLPSFLLIILSNAGAFLGMFFFGQSMNISSMLGIVMLVGLVVNDAILVMDYAIMKMRAGMDVKDAVFEGTILKFRAIILTTLCVIIGTMPQLWSVAPLKSAMGAVIIGGMAAASVYTFVFIPIAFVWVCRFIAWMKSKDKFSVKRYWNGRSSASKQAAARANALVP